jgi:hypothetical protein
MQFIYRTVPVVKCMADKSTKTDDILLNGEAASVNGTVSCKPIDSVSSKQQHKQGQTNAVSTASKPVPTTTNASTMTSAVVVTNIAPAPARALVAATTSTGTTAAASLTTTAASSQADVCSATVSLILLVSSVCTTVITCSHMRCLVIMLLMPILLHLI